MDQVKEWALKGMRTHMPFMNNSEVEEFVNN